MPSEERIKALEVAYKGSLGFILNMSDTFAFASADAEELSDYDFEKMIPIIAKYGQDALTAYVAVKRKAEPISCKCNHKNENYYAAKKEIEALKAVTEYFMED